MRKPIMMILLAILLSHLLILLTGGLESRASASKANLYSLAQSGATLSINDVSLAESNVDTRSFVFTVTLSGAHPTVTVNFATADGAPPNGATAPSDYFTRTGTLTFPASQNDATLVIGVVVNGDTTVEPDETFFVNLSNASGATISDGQGVGTIVNDDGSACTFAINPTSANFPAAGGNASVAVTAPTGCTWTAVSQAAWITITSGSSGSGNGTVNYTVAQNTGAARTGTMTIAGQTFTVTQEVFTCTYAINPTDANYAATGGSGTVAVTTQATCNWTATSSAAWLTITSGASGTGSGVVNYTVAANTTPDTRFSSMTIAGQTFSVRQTGDRPSIVIGDASITEGNAGTRNAVFTITLSAPVMTAVGINMITADGTAMTANNDYTATSGAVIFPANNNSPQTLSVPIIGDTSNEPDEFFFLNVASSSIEVVIADGQGVCTIVNDDNIGACGYSIAPLSQHFPASGGSGSVAVTAPDGCNWAASSNSFWITIENGINGTGSGVVNYRVQRNDGFTIPRSRTGSITIANKTFTVSQDGTNCEFSLRPARQTFPVNGGTGSFQVTAASYCEWEAIVGLPRSESILSISSGNSGRGNGTVSFSVSPNFTRNQRMDEIEIRNRRDPSGDAIVFRVTQEAGDGSTCTYSFSPVNQSFSSDGGQSDFTITTQNGCNILPVSNVDWIILSPLSGNPVQYRVAPNRGSFRSGSISVGRDSFVVYQDPVECPVELICSFFPSACGITNASSDESILSVSRNFRDAALAKTERGKQYTRLYYQFANEAVQILSLNPLLILRSSEILQKYKPVVEAMAKGEAVTLTAGDLDEIDGFLNDLAAKGSQEMQQSVKSVCQDLRDLQVQKEFNVTVVEGAKRELSSSSQTLRKLTVGLALCLGFCPVVLFAFRRRRRIAKGAKAFFVLALSLALANVLPMSSANAKPRAKNLPASAQPDKKLSKQVDKAYAKLPLTFEPASPTQFIARGNGYSLALSPTTATLAFSSSKSKDDKHDAASGLPTTRNDQLTTDTLQMQLVGANPTARIEGVDQLEAQTNYLLGNDPAKWRVSVKNYAKVKCANVYEGIDMLYYGNRRDLEYDFKLAPGADYQSIALAFDGAKQMRLDANGDLVLSTANGEVRQPKPVAYQEINGTRRDVACHYVFVNESKAAPQMNPKAGQQIRFALGDYDKSQPLIIDPVLAYSTYLGGNGTDEGTAITVDVAGNLYVAGFTTSTNFPTLNASQPTIGGGQQDAFIAKLNASGTALLYATYIGGNGQDNASSIAVDAAGNAYVTGFTASPNFPVKDALQATNRGTSNAFIMKLNAVGAAVYATFLGGGGNDTGTGIALDAAGNVYVAGITTSPNFPLLNATQARLQGATDLFIAKVNAAGKQLLFSTYLGGTGSDAAMSMALDAAGNLYLTGVTTSRDLPVVNALQQRHGGGFFDGFAAKVNTINHELGYLTYFGGSGEDRCFRLAVDAAGNAYVVGDSDSANLPTANALQSVLGGSADAFVAKVSPAGSLIYATYLGGSGIDGATAVAVNQQGEAYVTGFTTSRNFPISNHLQGENGGSFDAFIAKLNATGKELGLATYLGGSGLDTGFGIAVDAAGNAYVMGQTVSQNFPITNPLQRSFGGGTADLFVAKINVGSQANSLQINGASLTGKKLTIFGNGFSNGAKILLNGQQQKTANDEQNPTSTLIAAKAGKKIVSGESVMIQVRNADGTVSNQFRFTR